MQQHRTKCFLRSNLVEREEQALGAAAFAQHAQGAGKGHEQALSCKPQDADRWETHTLALAAMCAKDRQTDRQEQTAR